LSSSVSAASLTTVPAARPGPARVARRGRSWIDSVSPAPGLLRLPAPWPSQPRSSGARSPWRATRAPAVRRTPRPSDRTSLGEDQGRQPPPLRQSRPSP